MNAKKANANCVCRCGRIPEGEFNADDKMNANAGFQNMNANASVKVNATGECECRCGRNVKRYANATANAKCERRCGREDIRR